MASEQARRSTRPVGGFTLIELMVVILIIAVIIAILIPAVAGVRTAAKKSSTQALLNSITHSVTQFQADERRLPGFFAEKDMGSTQNATRGLSSMQNIMLDLIGMPSTGATATDPKIGPTTQTEMQFAYDLFGVPGQGTKQYFNPDPKFYQFQTNGTQQVSEVALGHSTPSTATDQRQLKSVVDAWGTPLLCWRQDETAVTPVAQAIDFAAADSSAATPSRFYWASNACFLKASGAGRGYDENTYSLIGGAAAANTTNLQNSLIGFLGSPSYPLNLGAAQPITLATAPRAPLIVHSAGGDGIYLSSKDRGAKQFNLTARNYIDYGVNHAPDPTQPVSATNRYLDSDSKPTNIDILARFDDLLSSAGN